MRARPAIVFAIATFAGATPALADAIDGDWCTTDGHSLSIQGTRIKTPGGATISGDYARHWFTYVAPKGDADAGQTVFLRLFDDNDMGSAHIKDGQAVDAMVLWHRCQPIS